MTESDIQRQQADALLAHHTANIRRNQIATRLREIGKQLQFIGGQLSTGAWNSYFEGDESPTWKPTDEFPSWRESLNYDRIGELVREHRAAEREVRDATANAKAIGLAI